MNYFITGGTGFIGTHLSSLLHEVHPETRIYNLDIVEPGMVFCVDIGIYCEEWGIGFRLEDNCLVTEDSCENLTASIPRTIEEIESVMGGE